MNLRSLLGPAWRRQWRWLAIGIVLMLASTFAALVLLTLSGWLITASALTGLGMIAALDIFTPGAGIRLAAVTRTVARYGERLATHRATLGLLAALRVNLMERLLRLDERQLRRLRRGETLDRFTRDVEALDHLFAGVAGPLATAILTTIGVSTALALLVSSESGMVAAAIGAASLGVTACMGRAGHKPGRALAVAEPQLRRRSTESLEGLKSLIAERRVADHRQMLASLSTPQVERQRRLERLDAVGRGLVDLVGFVGVWAMLLVVLTRLDTPERSGPLAVMAVVVTLGLMEVWQALPAAWRQLTRTRLAARRVTEMAGREPALPLSGSESPPEEGALTLDDVHLAWPGNPQPVIDGLNLTLARGERLLVTGPSGCGKTTLALLMMRQIDPDAGAVRIGAVDLRDIDADKLRRHIGYLPQQPVLFGDTLAANLRVAAPDADDGALTQALRNAGLGRWLDSLDDGLETWLDEAGASLSGGELRRVGLARLMLVDPPIAILDEPTTGLDAAIASDLAANLEPWLENRTVVMISHEPALLPAHDHELRLPAPPTA